MRLLFDRGTLLLDGAVDSASLDDVPGLLWDPRVGAYRAPAWRYVEVASGLARGGVRFADEVRAVSARPATWSAIALRPYQDEALAAWTQAGQRGVVILPTGSGKTRLGLAAIARLRVPALCLVPTRVLVDQWCREISSVSPEPVGKYGDGVRDARLVTVATYESAYRHMDQLGNRFELLVVDEAHHFGAGMRDEALEMAIAPFRLGLTATPLTDDGALRRIDQLIGPPVYQLGIGDLTGTFLAHLDVVTLHVDLTATERDHHDRLVRDYKSVFAALRRTMPAANWAELARAAAGTTEGRRAVQAWRSARRLVSLCDEKRVAVAELLARHRDARTLVFTADNDAAYAIAREHLVMPITCDIGRDERDDALAQFRRGALRALVSARVLNEGLDVPDAEVAIVVGATAGVREHVQRIGRLLRPAPGKRALVYELVARRTADVTQASRRRIGLAPRSAAHVSHRR